MRPKPNPKIICQHRSTLGRRCRMLLAPNHPTLCTFHARAEAKAEAATQAQAVATELLADTENLTQPASVNLFLANLLKNFANHRISRRDATTLAYISQLILNSQCVMHRQAKDAQAAKAAEPEQSIMFVPRPCRRLHVDDPPSSGNPPSSRSGGSSDPFPSPTQHALESSGRQPAPRSRSGESSDSHLSPSTPNPAPATPTPNANKVLYTPDDPEPYHPTQPLPPPVGRRV